MQRKPDLLWILVIIFGLGIVTTGYAQGLWSGRSDIPIQVVQQQAQQRHR